MASLADWQKRVSGIIAAREGALAPSSQLEIVEFKPNREKDELFIFAGSSDSVVTQISLFKAFHEYMEMKFANQSSVDFKKWCELFEDGFKGVNKLNPKWNNPANPWGVSVSQKPRIVIHTQDDAYKNQGFKVVEFLPNRDEKTESYLFSGTDSSLIQQISDFYSNYLLMREYDWGTFVGQPNKEYIRNSPSEGISVRIMLATKKSPPFYKTAGDVFFGYHQVTIPGVDRSKLTYQNLRDVCGGDAGQQWGEFACRAYVGFGGNIPTLHQVVARGTSKQAAKANLKKFLSLTSLPVRRYTNNEIDLAEADDAKNPKSKYLKSFSVYPCFISVINSRLVRIDDLEHSGKTTLAGKLLSKSNRLYLTSSQEPPNFQETIRDLTKTPVFG